MQYRRDFTEGATYFFTVVTFRRARFLNTEDAVARLRTAFKEERVRRPFVVDAIVILPDHIHSIWTLPEGDADYSIRWRNIKRTFTQRIAESDRPAVFASRRHKGEQAIWQRRFWEHRIRDENDFSRHVDYIHYNPVKHGYVARPADWAYSSIHRYIRQGILPATWGSDAIAMPDNIGYE
ncbi:REP-associated tyrosine transposase [Methyloglobulus sp.]|uniref:REP-associated tyrosine transposase n=1 Tax=Methyloglobulus sp. TaxID=2518622 RepID=UPI00398A4EA3